MSSSNTTSELPFVSIITPTYNRRNTIRLALVNFSTFDYPRNKLEWIIIDDGTDPIKDILPNDERIKYFYFDNNARNKLYKTMTEKLSKLPKRHKKKNGLMAIHRNGFANNKIPVGMKRNIACSKANGSVIVHMDDDDYIFPEGLKKLVSALDDKHLCTGMCVMPTFDVNNYVSTICEKTMKSYRAFYNCSLCYTKQFWKDKQFDNQSVKNESFHFLKQRSYQCKELKDKEIMVKLFHKGNNITNGVMESNGFHFGEIPENIFLLMTSFDN